MPDEADIGAFFLLYGAGDPRADFNGSGGIPDDADVVLFFQVWDAGIGQGTADDNRFGWRGYMWDARLGLYHVRHRVYDPWSMSWLQRDPAWFKDSLNRYAYCRGDLENGYDPYGLWRWDDDWVETALKFTPVGMVLHVILDPNGATQFYSAAYEGLVDGLAMAADQFTFGQVDSLHAHSQRLMEENGAAYQVAYAFSGISRDAAIMAATMGIGNSLLIGTRAGAVVSRLSATRAGQFVASVLESAGMVNGARLLGAGIGRTVEGDYAGGVHDIGTGLLSIGLSSRGLRATRESSTARARRLGMEGERSAGLDGPKTRIPIPGTNRTRIPDGLDATTLQEVKNVANLSKTSQIRDFISYAKSTDRMFELYVRPSTQLSGPLQDAVRCGDVTLRFIPGSR